MGFISNNQYISNKPTTRLSSARFSRRAGANGLFGIIQALGTPDVSEVAASALAMCCFLVKEEGLGLQDGETAGLLSIGWLPCWLNKPETGLPGPARLGFGDPA